MPCATQGTLPQHLQRGGWGKENAVLRKLRCGRSGMLEKGRAGS